MSETEHCEQPPVRALYIAGSGRSGSTVLELQLAEVSGFVALGEVRNGWKHGILENGLCGCGRSNTDCNFWSRCLSSLTENPAELAAETIEAQTKTMRMRSALTFAVKRRGTNDPIQRCYGSTIASLYREALRASEGSPAGVIDSSKNPAEAMLLRELASVQPFVVLMVRDPRDVIASTRRAKVQEGSLDKRLMTQANVGLAMLSWLAYNVGGYLARPDAIVFYDRFCEAAENHAQAICDRAGITTNSNVEAPDERHQIWGNPTRLFSSGKFTVSRSKSKRAPLDIVSGSLLLPIYHLLRRSKRTLPNDRSSVKR